MLFQQFETTTGAQKIDWHWQIGAAAVAITHSAIFSIIHYSAVGIIIPMSVCPNRLVYLSLFVSQVFEMASATINWTAVAVAVGANERNKKITWKLKSLFVSVSKASVRANVISMSTSFWSKR